MPVKLRVLIGLLSVSILLSLFSQSWLTLLVNTALLVGLAKGNEAVRTTMIVLAWLGIAQSGLECVLGLSGLGTVVTTLMGVFGLIQNGWVVWCLRQPDVQHWMFRKANPWAA